MRELFQRFNSFSAHRFALVAPWLVNASLRTAPGRRRSRLSIPRREMKRSEAELMQYRKPVGPGPFIEYVPQMRVRVFRADFRALHAGANDPPLPTSCFPMAA